MEAITPIFSLKTTVKIQLGEDTFEIKYPTVGQLIEINNKKYILTDNRYADLSLNPSKTVLDVYYLDLVDAVSHFTVLSPTMMRKLGVDALLELDGITGAAVIKAYKEQFRPWYIPFLKKMLRPDEKEEEAEKDNEESKKEEPAAEAK